MERTETYQPNARYRWMGMGSGVLFLLLGWNIVSPWLRGHAVTYSDMDTGLLFFLAVSFAIALWYLRLALSHVRISSTAVTLSGPLTRTKTVTIQQMAGLSVSDRAGHAITVLFHPNGRNGLIDPDEIASLTLPEVDDQDVLLADLEERMPQ